LKMTKAAAVFTVLGSGSFSPEAGAPVRNPAGYMLRGGGEILLADIGFGNLRRLAQAGVSPADADTVFLTHFHPDHWGDLPALLFSLRYTAAPKSALTIYGPVGTKKLVSDIHSAFRGYTKPDAGKLTVKEIGPDELIKTKAFIVRTAKTKHTPESLALRFETDGGAVAYTGDALYTPELAAFCSGATLLVADAGLVSAKAGRAHMTAAEAVKLARASCAQFAVLSHLTSASAKAAQKLVRGDKNIVLAQDLLTVNLAPF